MSSLYSDLLDALREITGVLSAGKCDACQCQGCLHEMGEARKIALAALERAGKERAN